MRKRIAILGGGPSGLFLYKRLLESGRKDFTVEIFEAKSHLGYGMPYSPDRRRQLDISSKLRYWTPEETKLLGTIPDAQVAQRLSRTLCSVQNRRLKLGIPPGANPKY